MTGRYKQFLRLLESWPLDSSKKGRDLGQHIREKIAEAFPTGETSKINVEECANVHASLKRLADNYYGDKFKRTHSSSATGLTLEQCSGITSTEFLREVSAQNKGFSIFRKKKDGNTST